MAEDGAPVATTTVRVGDLTVTSVLDAEGEFPARADEVLTGAGAEDWAAARRIDPDAFGDAGAWHLRFQCVLVRRPGAGPVLVDTGVGAAGSPAAAWAPVPGRLPRALAEAGVAAEDVRTVVLTHVHEDHVGWVVDQEGRPLFTGAEHLVQVAELDWLRESGSALWERTVQPLREAGLLVAVDGDLGLDERGAGERLSLVHAPGHTPGHQVLRVRDAGTELVVGGDLLVHAVQLANPSVRYRFETAPAVAAASRRAVLDGVRRSGALLATAHLNQPFTRVGDGAPAGPPGDG